MAVRTNRVLLIGAGSFTGIHLSKVLQENGYSTTLTAKSNVANGFIELDILEKKQLEAVFCETDFDYVINLAASAFVADDARHKFYESNVLGVENILEALISSGKSYEKIIMPSSATVYGPQKSNVLSEDMPPCPVSHYGYSKYIGEKLCEKAFGKLPIVVPRPFNYTGLNQDERFVIPKIVSSFKSKCSAISLGNLNTYREYNSVKYISNLYLQLMSTSFESGVVNFASGELFSISDVIAMMERISGRKIDVKIDSEFVRKNEIESLSGCCKKLHSIISTMPHKYSLEDTLREMYLS